MLISHVAMGFSWCFLKFIMTLVVFSIIYITTKYFEQLSEIITVILLYFQLQIIYYKILNNIPENIYDKDWCKLILITYSRKLFRLGLNNLRSSQKMVVYSVKSNWNWKLKLLTEQTAEISLKFSNYWPSMSWTEIKCTLI